MSYDPTRAADLPRGVLCPNPACRSPDSRTPHTRRHPGKLIRFRVCKQCGRRFRTVERVG